MKKFLLVISVVLSALCINVSASTLADAMKVTAKHYGVVLSTDTTYADMLHNSKNLTDKPLVSSMIESGLLVCKNNVVNPSSSDFTPLTDGVVRKFITDNNYSIVAGTLAELERSHHVGFDDKTLYLTPNFVRDDLNPKDLYTCVIGQDNVAQVIWVAGEVKQPCILRAKLYWAEQDLLIVKNAERKAFGFWVPQNKDGYTELNMDDYKISEQFTIDNLDKNLYIFADCYGGNFRVLGIGRL